jgi:hypothetical protein
MVIKERPMGNSVQMNFRITPELRGAVAAAAKQSGLTLPDWLRYVVARAAHEGAFAPRMERRAHGTKPKTARKPRATGG